MRRLLQERLPHPQAGALDARPGTGSRPGGASTMIVDPWWK